MSAMSKRVYLELLAAKKVLETLRKENQNLKHQCRLAYLEGFDQGQVSVIREAS